MTRRPIWNRPIWTRRINALSAGAAVLGSSIVCAYLGWTAAQRTVERSRFSDPGLGLQELIQGVKQELQRADLNRAANDEAALFRLRSFDLEISFGVKAVDKSKGQLEYKVVTIGSEHEFSRETTQKVTIHLDAIGPQKFTEDHPSVGPPSGGDVIKLPKIQVPAKAAKQTERGKPR